MTTEEGVAVVRLRDGEALPREALEGVVAKGVQVGHSQLRIELGEGWRERLHETLERLAALRADETLVHR